MAEIPHLLVHEHNDNVGVVVIEGLTAGTDMLCCITHDNSTFRMTAGADVPIGHKIALTDLKTGDTATKYGEDIGVVLAGVDMWMRTLKIGLPISMKHHADYTMTGRADLYPKIEYPKPDGEISFDRLTSVAFSFTNHAEDQPVHLQLGDSDLQKASEYDVFGGPSSRYCPAGVYEYVEEDEDEYE